MESSKNSKELQNKKENHAENIKDHEIINFDEKAIIFYLNSLDRISILI